MASSDPFSSSVIPFEVPEQMRAFAEKGVSQARDSYAKFKDVAESNNGTIEAVFSCASKGASEYSAKLMEIMKANSTATLDFAQELLGIKIAFRGGRAVELPRQEAVRDHLRPGQGARRAGPEGRDRDRRADQGECVETVQAGRLIDHSAARRPGPTARASCFLPSSRGLGSRDRWPRRPCQRRALHLVSAPFGRPFFGAGEGCSCSSVG